MKRSTLAIGLAAAILIAGALAVWFLVVAPRLKPPAVVTTPPPVVTPPPAQEAHGALNLYLAAPEQMPAGVARVELTLTKATLIDAKGGTSPAFDGVQRVMLQSGTAEKVLSELVHNGSWSGLALEFSPTAVVSLNDGTVVTDLLGQRDATLSFQADLPISRTLSLFARVPLDPNLQHVAGVWTANLLKDPQPAEHYVFGSFMQDTRGRSDLWTLPRLSLADVIKADLGMDITAVLPGSQGFSAATGQSPVPKPPQ